MISEHSQVQSGFMTLNFCYNFFAMLLLLLEILLESDWFLSLHSHQLVCLATFLNVSENDSFDPYQVLTIFPSILGKRSSVKYFGSIKYIAYSWKREKIEFLLSYNYNYVLNLCIIVPVWTYLYMYVYIDSHTHAYYSHTHTSPRYILFWYLSLV